MTGRVCEASLKYVFDLKNVYFLFSRAGFTFSCLKMYKILNFDKWFLHGILHSIKIWIFLKLKNKKYPTEASNTAIQRPPSIEVPQGPYPTYVTNRFGKVVPVVQVYCYTKYLGHLELNFDQQVNQNHLPLIYLCI